MMLSVDFFKPGMILTENIYDLEKVLLLSSGTVLTSENINTIKHLGYIEIKVADKSTGLTIVKSDQQNKARVERFTETYGKMKDEVADMIKYISDGNQINVDQVHNIPRTLLNQIGNPADVFAYLKHVSILDDHTMGHSINVSLICGTICNWLDVNQDVTRDALVAGMLHDVGKSAVPPEILNKSGPLSPEEWSEIKKHPSYGYRMLKKANAPEPVLTGALMHHEREDGKGYPFGLNHSKIPLIAKIVAIADIYDAMTSNRCYRTKLCPFHVIRQFQNNFFGVLDTKILMTFLARIAECYIGELVLLSKGTIGEIVYISPANPSKPLVKTTHGLINLQEQDELEIDGIIA